MAFAGYITKDGREIQLDELEKYDLLKTYHIEGYPYAVAPRKYFYDLDRETLLKDMEMYE